MAVKTTAAFKGKRGLGSKMRASQHVWAEIVQADADVNKRWGRSDNPALRTVGREGYDRGRKGPSRGRTFGNPKRAKAKR